MALDKGIYNNNNDGNNSNSNNTSLLDTIEDKNSNTFETYYKKQQSKLLHNTINSLPDELKQLCRLLISKNVTDIAKELKLSRKTIYQRINKIKKVLKGVGLDKIK